MRTGPPCDSERWNSSRSWLENSAQKISRQWTVFSRQLLSTAYWSLLTVNLTSTGRSSRRIGLKPLLYEMQIVLPFLKKHDKNVICLLDSVVTVRDDLSLAANPIHDLRKIPFTGLQDTYFRCCFTVEESEYNVQPLAIDCEAISKLTLECGSLLSCAFVGSVYTNCRGVTSAYSSNPSRCSLVVSISWHRRALYSNRQLF